MDLSQAEEYFQKYYEKLIWQTFYARAHLTLWERLESFQFSHLKELNQAPHFFAFTIQAHLDDALMTLSRIIRRQRGALTIWKFLDFVEKNLEIFSNEAFSRRKGNKPNYEERKIKSHIPIAHKRIEEDKQRLLNLQDTINNLIIWRDKIIAHIDHKILIMGKIIPKEYPLQRQHLRQVINTLFEILDRYSYAYDGSTFLKAVPGEDDVRYVMDSIRFEMEERKKQLEALRKRASEKG